MSAKVQTAAMVVRSHRKPDWWTFGRGKAVEYRGRDPNLDETDQNILEIPKSEDPHGHGSVGLTLPNGIEIIDPEETVPDPHPVHRRRPLLKNYDPTQGDLYHLKAYSIPLRIQDMAHFVDRILDEHRTEHMGNAEKMFHFQDKVMEYLPPEVFGLTQLWIPVSKHQPVWEPCSIVIATNESEEEIEFGEDSKALVEEIQEILMLDTPAAWYHVLPPEDDYYTYLT
ncbi:hypothetical protein FA15DRAFT_659293 [Coprinopsis marcescibilis]|uniref:Uncharacterized protein n=1 Tax=Coprinopsis marcescibilis TaxID=230819 RepID=A0A5C3KJU2_COPMA|nr:hypothetical protein FA15DRAFT_659293 [Coprinopsis marcescibilis]